MIIPYKPKIILAVLFAVSVMTAFSFVFLKEIDAIVHTDLYLYGLTFNYNWADRYWTNSNLFLYCQTLALILFGNAIAFFFSHLRSKSTFSSSASSLLLLVGSGLNIFSIYLLYTIDSIVNFDLYLYGLTFNIEWFAPYSQNYRIMLLLVSLAGFLALASAILIYNSAKKARILPAKLLDSTLIAIGTVSIALSIIYSSSILALIGLGLLFWGITFTYIGNDTYVKKNILDATASSEVKLLDRLIQKMGYSGNPIYLPPQYFRDKNIYKVCIPKHQVAVIPTPDKFSKQELDSGVTFIENPPAILITPPGTDLAKLMEETLKTDLSTVNLQFLQQRLPALIIEELELSQYFNLEYDNEKIRVTIEGSVFKRSNSETENPSVSFSLGSPLTSAIACVIAKVTGKPVVRATPKTDIEDKPLVIEYLLLSNSQETMI